MDHDLAPGTVEPTPGEVDPADDDRQHIVEIVRDAAGQLADRLHLLDLAELGFGRLPLDRFGAKRFVRFLKLLRSLGDRLFKGCGALGLGIRPRFRAAIFRRIAWTATKARKMATNADDHAKPAQIIGQAVGLRRKYLALLDALPERGLLAGGNFLKLAAERGSGWRKSRGIEIGSPALSLLGRGGAGCNRQLLSARKIKLLKLLDPLALRRVVAQQCCKLVDLMIGQSPLAIINVAAGADFLVEHEAPQSGLGAGNAGIDAANNQRDIIGLSFGLERLLTGIIRQGDQDDHDQQDEGRDQPARCRASAPPVKLNLVPRWCHGGSLDPDPRAGKAAHL